jgi:hypothetical protein
MVGGWRCTWRPQSSNVGDTLGGHISTRLEAVFVRHWGCTLRPWTWAVGDRYRGSVKVSLQAVDWQRARYWHSIHQAGLSQPWKCDKVTLPCCSDEELDDWCQSCSEACRKPKQHPGVQLECRKWRKDKQSGMDAVCGVCCTQSMHVLSVCFTQCQLIIITWKDTEGWLKCVFCDDGVVVDKKDWDGGWRWERCGEYEHEWEISGRSCLIQLRIPRICHITCRIRLVLAVLWIVTWLAHEILLCPIFSWWFPTSPLISLFLVLNSTIF